ncbi:MAG TPA: hypothetical protein VFQ39_20420 [Longimicrobium sp.]|nr:hypothetical protein [Longimicrobium sp.]
MSRTVSLSCALAVVLMAGACRDIPVEPKIEPPPAPTRGMQLRCSVDVPSRKLGCDETGGDGGPRASIILGGQGLHVRLASSGVRYESGVLQAEVTVRNLLDQPMGTDGATTTGTRVFFHAGPTATEGTGAVTVLSDGTGTFTAANQPFYQYDGVIQPGAVSAARTWSFTVPATVVRFDFVVFVDTRLPAEESVLHWRAEQAPIPYGGPVWTLSATAPDGVFAAGRDTIMHFDGNAWRIIAAPCDCRGVWAIGPNEAVSIGTNGEILHWADGRWETLVSTGMYQGALWASSSHDVWAMTDDTLTHFDGEGLDVHPVALPLGGQTTAIGGTSPSNVWAVGAAGMILQWNGLDWVSRGLNQMGVDFVAVWGTGPNDMWTAGFEDCACGPGTAYHYSGAAWARVPNLPGVTNTMLTGGASGAPDDVWITTYTGSILHYDGSAWSIDRPVAGVNLRTVTAPARGVAFAAGETSAAPFHGVILRNDGDGWRSMDPPHDSLTGLWGSSANDLWAVGGTSIRHRVGGRWSVAASPDGMPLADVWGASADDVWAVGDSGVARFDGAGWSRAAGPGIPLHTVWGSSPTDVWAGGFQALAHWNGSSWSTTPVGTGRFAKIWGSSSAKVFAVGQGGDIRRWDGTAWTAMSSGTTRDLSDVWGAGPDDVYAVGAGIVLHYDGNAAGVWTEVSVPVNPALSIEAVWGTASDDVFILANRGTTVVRWNGTAWRTLANFPPTGRRLRALWGTSARDLYAAGDSGTVVHGTR